MSEPAMIPDNDNELIVPAVLRQPDGIVLVMLDVDEAYPVYSAYMQTATQENKPMAGYYATMPIAAWNELEEVLEQYTLWQQRLEELMRASKFYR